MPACVHTVLVSVLLRNGTSRMCIYKEIYSKELVHMIVEASRSKICRVDQQAGDPQRANIADPV